MRAISIPVSPTDIRPGQRLYGQLSTYSADGSCRRIGSHLGDRFLRPAVPGPRETARRLRQGAGPRTSCDSVNCVASRGSLLVPHLAPMTRPPPPPRPTCQIARAAPNPRSARGCTRGGITPSDLESTERAELSSAGWAAPVFRTDQTICSPFVIFYRMWAEVRQLELQRRLTAFLACHKGSACRLASVRRCPGSGVLVLGSPLDG